MAGLPGVAGGGVARDGWGIVPQGEWLEGARLVDAGDWQDGAEKGWLAARNATAALVWKLPEGITGAVRI